jgi:hypothetical protein
MGRQRKGLLIRRINGLWYVMKDLTIQSVNSSYVAALNHVNAFLGWPESAKSRVLRARHFGRPKGTNAEERRSLSCQHLDYKKDDQTEDDTGDEVAQGAADEIHHFPPALAMAARACVPTPALPWERGGMARGSRPPFSQCIHIRAISCVGTSTSG